MPTFRYGARPYVITVPQQLNSTAANVNYGGFQYLPTITVNQEQERIKNATLVFPSAIATAASTAAAGSMQIVLTQYNSSGNSQNSAILFDQSLNSQAANTPLDVSTLCNGWNLNAGDTVVLTASSHTVGVPVNGGVIFSCFIDAQTAV